MPLLRGTFCFLNGTAELGQPIDWAASAILPLWRLNLHHLDNLHSLTPRGQVDLS